MPTKFVAWASRSIPAMRYLGWEWAQVLHHAMGEVAWPPRHMPLSIDWLNENECAGLNITCLPHFMIGLCSWKSDCKINLRFNRISRDAFLDSYIKWPRPQNTCIMMLYGLQYLNHYQCKYENILPVYLSKQILKQHKVKLKCKPDGL